MRMEVKETRVRREIYFFFLFVFLWWLAGVEGETVKKILVLNNRSPWRCYQVWRTPEFRVPSGELVALPFRDNYPLWGFKTWKKKGTTVKVWSSAPPPAGWRGRDFDDSSWTRVTFPFSTAQYYMGLLCVRCRFEVKDPRRVERMDFRLLFRGGAVVYLNGREITRAYLPEGVIGYDTPAEDYPEEAYLRPDGRGLLSHVWHKKHPEWLRHRRRELSVVLPQEGLRKGVNVLAVELHRAPTSYLAVARKPKHSFAQYWWSTLAVEKVELTAAGGGARPNTEPPAGFRVWNHPVTQRVSVAAYGDPCEKLRPVLIKGTRNGVFSGKIVVGCRGKITGLKAEAEPLKGEKGIIPASRVLIRYGRPDAHRRYATIPVFDSLHPEPPRVVEPWGKMKGSVLPVWITVYIPPDAIPGIYKGKVTIRAEGTKPVDVPVELHVAGWRMPDPKHFASHVGLVQSPDSVALYYKVPMWSQEHWRLLEKSFRLLGEVGTKVLYIPIRRRTYFGNEHSMVRWIRQPDGGWRHDFSIVEKYVALAVKYLGKIPVVCVYCWDVDAGATYFARKKFSKKAPFPFTVLDPGSGKLKAAAGPSWGDPAIRPFLRPVFDGIRRILARYGLEKSLMVGIAGDRRPMREVVEDLKAVAPEAPWVVSSHGNPTALHGQPVGYLCYVWGVHGIPDPEEHRYHGWKNPELICPFPRAGSGVFGPGLRQVSPLSPYRTAVESALVSRGRGRGGAGLRGFGRCGADFWKVFPHKYYWTFRERLVCGRYPETSHWHGGWFHNSFAYILAPGREGAVATARFESLREGVEDAEARIYVERVLLDKELRGRIGEVLASRCRRLLDERTRSCRAGFIYGTGTSRWNALWYTSSGWQRRSWELFRAAEEVEKKIKDTSAP